MIVVLHQSIFKLLKYNINAINGKDQHLSRARFGNFYSE